MSGSRCRCRSRWRLRRKSPTRHATKWRSTKATSPVGIIDLECYSVVNRPGADDTGMVLELAGDPRSNPDLRSFYFEADDEDECVSWTNAFLCDRHTALMDEREAYRQVAESFPAQLQAC